MRHLAALTLALALATPVLAQQPAVSPYAAGIEAALAAQPAPPPPFVPPQVRISYADPGRIVVLPEVAAQRPFKYDLIEWYVGSGMDLGSTAWGLSTGDFQEYGLIGHGSRSTATVIGTNLAVTIGIGELARWLHRRYPDDPRVGKGLRWAGRIRMGAAVVNVVQIWLRR